MLYITQVNASATHAEITFRFNNVNFGSCFVIIIQLLLVFNNLIDYSHDLFIASIENTVRVERAIANLL